MHWAEAFDGDTLLRIAAARGQAMSDLAGDAGAMASLAADQDEVEALLDGEPVAIAGLNARRQTVVSGPVGAVGAVIARARERGFAAMRLPVSHAFHSPMMAGAVPALAQALAQRPIGRLRRTVVSTVTGARLAADADLRELLLRQVTSPVRFAAAMVEAAGGIDLWIEVGPGRVLSGLVPELIPAPVLSTEAGGPSLIGLLGAVGAAFALGAAGDVRLPVRRAVHSTFSARAAASLPGEPLRRSLPARTAGIAGRCPGSRRSRHGGRPTRSCFRPSRFDTRAGSTARGRQGGTTSLGREG